ncbi:hypothetical protein J6590_044917, partial [Homalodisca vitripennis]
MSQHKSEAPRRVSVCQTNMRDDRCYNGRSVYLPGGVKGCHPTLDTDSALRFRLIAGITLHCPRTLWCAAWLHSRPALLSEFNNKSERFRPLSVHRNGLSVVSRVIFFSPFHTLARIVLHPNCPNLDKPSCGSLDYA